MTTSMIPTGFAPTRRSCAASTTIMVIADFQVVSSDVQFDESGNFYNITITVDEGARLYVRQHLDRQHDR